MKISLFRTFTFEAAHANLAPGVEERVNRMHGHSYEATVWIEGDTNEHLGWLVDFADVKATCKPIIDILDHRCLNDIDGITDASIPDVQSWLSTRLRDTQTGFSRCVVRIRDNAELTPTMSLDDGLACVEFDFAAAHFLPHLPQTHKCRRMHGHSYRLSLLGTSSADIIEGLEPVYRVVDHRVLNDISGLANPTAEHLAHWVWNQMDGRAVELQEVRVKETCMMGCMYRGEDT